MKIYMDSMSCQLICLFQHIIFLFPCSMPKQMKKGTLWLRFLCIVLLRCRSRLGLGPSREELQATLNQRCQKVKSTVTLGGKYFFFFFLFSFFLFLCVFVKIATLILLELCQIERTKTISQCLTFFQTDWMNIVSLSILHKIDLKSAIRSETYQYVNQLGYRMSRFTWST